MLKIATKKVFYLYDIHLHIFECRYFIFLNMHCEIFWRFKLLWILQDVRSASIMTCLFWFFAIASFRFNFSLRYWFHRTRSWFSNICLTSHHVWVLLESHKPVSSALNRVGATGAMVRGYRGLDHRIMGHGVVDHLQFQMSMLQVGVSNVNFIQVVAHTQRVGFLQLVFVLRPSAGPRKSSGSNRRMPPADTQFSKGC